MNELLLKELNKNIEDLNEKLRNINQNVFSSREAAEYLRIGYDTILFNRTATRNDGMPKKLILN